MTNIETRNCEKCGQPFQCKRWDKKRFCNKACSDAMGWQRRHGLSNSPEWIAWKAMRSRCRYVKNKDYGNYGGRGITVCERWDSFEAFLEDMGPKPTPQHTVDRIDFNGNYEPSNCRWATRFQQTRNKRDAWTPEEDAKLRQALLDGLNFQQAAKVLGKTVHMRAYRLGLKSNYDPRAPRGPQPRRSHSHL